MAADMQGWREGWGLQGITGKEEKISNMPSGWTFCFQNQIDACYGTFPLVITDTQHVFREDLGSEFFSHLHRARLRASQNMVQAAFVWRS